MSTARGRLRRPVAALAAALGLLLVAAAPVDGAVRGGAVPSYRVSAPRPDCPARGTAQDTSVADATSPGGRRALWIYRPAVADTARLPVLYLLHGLPGSSRDWYDSGLAYDLDRAICAGAAPFVVAALDGSGPGGLDTEWADDVQGRVRLESLLTGRVLGVVEGQHRRTRRNRAVAGYSMGGYGAMVLAERHPELYGSVAALAGYFHVDDPDVVFGGDASAHDPGRLARRALPLRVYLGVGSEETTPGIAGETQRYGQVLAALHHPRLEEVVVHGNHSLQTVRRLFPSLLRFLEAGWR